MKKIYGCAFVYLIVGLVLGVFYREFTVYHQFTEATQLSILHTHTLMLGTVFFIIVLMLERLFNLTANKRFYIWLLLYNIGLGGLLLTLLIRGTGQVLSWELSGLNHIAGLFHTILGAALVWFMLILGRRLKTNRAL